MKVAELREKLSKLKKDEIIKLSVEFYKLVPKSKKEDYDLDSLINNPNKKKASTNSKSKSSLNDIELELNQFIEHAKEQYYLYPNQVVPKKERSTWRFKVKRWYKELINTKRADGNIAKQSELLSNLYELICESCGYEYFSAYDSFQSIGIDQSEFYKSVITLIQEDKGKGESLEKAIKLIIENYLNRYTLYSTLMRELMTTLGAPDLKEKGIEIVKRLIIENGYKPNPNEETKMWSYSTEQFRKKRKHNNLTELGYRFYCNLFELENGINFYQENHYERDEEIKLYILIRLLFEEKKKNNIKEEIEKAIQNGIQPRAKLLVLLKEIKEHDSLPNYM